MAGSPVQNDLARAFVYLGLIVCFGLTSLGLTRLHYHSQNTLLRPDDYHIEVVTAAEYQMLADPQIREVKVGYGTIVKGDAFDAKRYQPINDGSQYAFIMLTGTAPMMSSLYWTVLPMLMMALIGLFLTGAALKRSQRQDTKTTG